MHCRLATAAASGQINARLGREAFKSDSHALLMNVYKDPNQLIGLRMEAARPALAYEKPRLASIETKVVDEFEKMTDEELDAEIASGVAELAAARGGIGTQRAPRRALSKPH